MSKEYIKKVIRTDALILLAILILAAIFRFYKLRTAPDWFVDEGEFIRLADYISKGNFNFMGIRNSMLLIGRLPLFVWILAGIFKLFGTDILVLRSITVLCSILSIGICYSFVQQSLGKTSAFYAALLLAILPEYIFYNRIGFTYNWTSLWMLIFVLSLWKYLKQDSQQWLVTACLAAGIAFASDYIGIICILVLVFVLAIFHPTHLWKVILAGIPVLISVLPIFIIAPGDAWYDLRFMRFLGQPGEESIGSLFLNLILGYAGIFQRQPLIILGMVGLFTLPDKLLRGLILLVVSGVFVLFLPVRTLMGHYLLPVWPLLMIGLGSFLERSIAYVYSLIKSSLINLRSIFGMEVGERLNNSLGSIGSTLVVFAIIFLPITWMIILNFRAFIIEPLNPSLVLLENPWSEGFIKAVDAEAIAKEIIPTLKPEDFVIAPGQVSWMLPCNTADIRTVGTYEFGGKVADVHYFDIDRFIVNSSVHNARYVVVDNYWRVWMVNTAQEYDSMLEEVSNWPMLMSRGDLQLFCNPQYCFPNK